MARDTILTIVAVVLALLLMGTLSAFLLAVPGWPLAGVAVVLTAMILMFMLGVHAGERIGRGE